MISERAARRIEEERQTVEVMIRLYCRKCHNGSLCPECKQLLDFASARLNRCPQKEAKPTCAKCRIHCYSPDMREKMQKVMRFSGPRMMLYHPVMAVRHLWREHIIKGR